MGKSGQRVSGQAVGKSGQSVSGQVVGKSGQRVIGHAVGKLDKALVGKLWVSTLSVDERASCDITFSIFQTFKPLYIIYY